MPSGTFSSRAARPTSAVATTATVTTTAPVRWEQSAAGPVVPNTDGANTNHTPRAVATANCHDRLTPQTPASCLEARTGRVVWEERLGGSFSASPVLAGGRLYALSDAGETFVLKAGDDAEVLARNPLGEAAQATPAVAGGRLFIRTRGHLWSIAAK